MNSRQILDEKWIKASIAGTIWAASEIVLGSFLHNLKIPFAGNLLTGIGLIILISISYIWKEKGLFWRAGLICALMKTFSPSAVIFGPMIAIFSESVLLEASTRLLGRTIAGYLTGSMLAMSWNLLQKILNYIIFYGFNIVGLYTSLLKYAEKQFNIPIDMVWAPIIFLLIIYCVMGIIAAVTGIILGRRLPDQQPASFTSQNVSSALPKKNNDRSFRYSVVWLFADILLIPAALMLINTTRTEIWALFVVATAFTWSLRYKRALRQLLKPRFWILFVLITMLTAFAFTRINNNTSSISEGLLTGVQMNFRALIIIMGFSVLGTELYNPVIRNFFLKTSFRQLPLALELAFESLPSMIAAIPDFKTVVHNPRSVFYSILTRADSRLSEIKDNTGKKNHVFMITGGTEAGKTSMITCVARMLIEKGIKAEGILSPRITENGHTTGYMVQDISTGKSIPFLREDDKARGERIGRFAICREGLSLGRHTLRQALLSDCRIIVIDEIGKLELNGGGWAGNISELLAVTNKHLIITVRDAFIEDVTGWLKISNRTVFDVGRYECSDVEKHIADFLESEKAGQ